MPTGTFLYRFPRVVSGSALDYYNAWRPVRFSSTSLGALSVCQMSVSHSLCWWYIPLHRPGISPYIKTLSFHSSPKCGGCRTRHCGTPVPTAPREIYSRTKKFTIRQKFVSIQGKKCIDLMQSINVIFDLLRENKMS